MSLLTEDEEWNLWNAQGIDEMNQVEAIAFARAYAAAIMAKLASAELPEPDDYGYHTHDARGNLGWLEQWLYSEEQLTAWDSTRYAQGFAAGAASQLSAEPIAVMHRGELCIKSTDDDQSFGMLCPTTISEGTELYTRREAK